MAPYGETFAMLHGLGNFFSVEMACPGHGIKSIVINDRTAVVDYADAQTWEVVGDY